MISPESRHPPLGPSRSRRGERWADIKKGVALTFQDVIRAKYLLLTTFTKDGRPKPTPIWGVP
ncbi:MAG: uncharacterized protein QOJ61_2854, partial [Mycobacterium sp.]|nr:uncharacterized protein [Mycobacterium sp.]